MASSGILRNKTDKDDRVGIKLLSSEKNVQTIQKMKPVPYLGFKQTMAMFFYLLQQLNLLFGGIQAV